MPLFIKDDGVDELAKKLMTVTHASSKTDAVRAALQAALAQHDDRPKASDIARRFREALVAKAQPGGTPADKPFRDSLYEDG